MSGIFAEASHDNKFENKLINELIQMGSAFTRLEAKPEAIRDNLKNMLENPYILSKKGTRPYQEIEKEKYKHFAVDINSFPIRLADESERAMKRLYKKT